MSLIDTLTIKAKKKKILNPEISADKNQSLFCAWQFVNVDNLDCNVIINQGSSKLQGIGLLKSEFHPGMLFACLSLSKSIGQCECSSQN